MFELSNKSKITKLFFIISLNLILSGCLKKNEINIIGKIEFRKKYEGTSKLNENELDSIFNGNPILVNEEKNSMIKVLENQNIIFKNELVLKQFKKMTESFEIENTGGHKIYVKKYLDTISGINKIKILNNYSKLNLEVNPFCEIFYCIKNNKKENYSQLLLLEKYYLLMGDNYNLNIIKIK